MKYAIVESCGKQIWVEEGRFYDLNYIPGEPGDLIKLNKVLFFNEEGKIQVGKPCLHNILIEGTILRHLKNKKITVFKVKPKKNSKTKQGHRQKLTRLLIKKILISTNIPNIKYGT